MGRGVGLARTTVAWPATARKQSCRGPVRQSPPHGGGSGRVGLLCRGCADRRRAHPAHSLPLLLSNASASGAGLSRAGLSCRDPDDVQLLRSEEHTSELQSLMRISYAVFCLKKKIKTTTNTK